MKLGWLWVFPALGGLMIAGAVAVQVRPPGLMVTS